MRVDDGLLADGGHPHGERAVEQHRAGRDPVARAHGHRLGLAGEEREPHLARAVGDDAVGGELLARADVDPVARGERLDGDGDQPLALDAAGGAGHRGHERGGRVRGAAPPARLEQPAHEEQRHQHRERVEVALVPRRAWPRRPGRRGPRCRARSAGPWAGRGAGSRSTRRRRTAPRSRAPPAWRGRARASGTAPRTWGPSRRTTSRRRAPRRCPSRRRRRRWRPRCGPADRGRRDPRRRARAAGSPAPRSGRRVRGDRCATDPSGGRRGRWRSSRSRPPRRASAGAPAR